MSAREWSGPAAARPWWRAPLARWRALYGYLCLLPELPGLVVSGINHGPNMGEDVFYSGTVAAAIEGTLQGSPAIAASLVTREASDFIGPAQFIGRLARSVLDRGLGARRLLNVNMPHRPWDQVRGVQVTRLGSRVYQDTLVRKVDPRGRDYYWIGGDDAVWQPGTGTDFSAVDAGYVPAVSADQHIPRLGKRVGRQNQ